MLKLDLDLIPSTAFGKNVRALVTKKQWDLIRNRVYDEAWWNCQICEITPEKLDAHEIWSYNDQTNVQKLESIIALCRDCHMVKHFGFAQIQGKSDKALKHFMEVNQMKKVAAEQYIEKAFQQWSERSKKSWTLDVSILKNFGVDI
jgi:hypothetical protein